MAVGRRKRFASGTMPTSNGTLMTAGASPTDGSAAATVWAILTNVTGAGLTVSLIGPGSASFCNETLGANSTKTYGPLDLMGGETVVGAAGGVGVAYHFTGVEAKDS